MKDLNISVVIPNYNGAHLFPETLPTVYKALENTGKQFEIIIIDDCSTDDSTDYLKKLHPDIQVLKNEINSGFSITINKGIVASKYELVLLLNSDVKLSENYFENLFKYFDLPDTFGVMGKIIGWNDEEVQDGGKYPRFEGCKLKTSENYLPAEHTADSLFYSMYISGANALIRRDTLVLLNGFNELFGPFYMEDVDLSVRAWRSGHKCYFEPLSVCRHKTSESIRTKDIYIYIRTIYNRNKFYFHAIHYDGFWFTLWSVQTFFELLIRMLSFRFDYLQSCAAFARKWKAIKKSSQDFEEICIQTGVKLSLRSVARMIRKSLLNEKITSFRK